MIGVCCWTFVAAGMVHEATREPVCRLTMTGGGAATTLHGNAMAAKAADMRRKPADVAHPHLISQA